MKRIFSLLTLGTLGLATACSSSDSPATANSAGTTAYAQALCGYQQKCDPIGFQLSFGDSNGCLGFFQEEAQFGLALPGVKISDGELQSCADAYNAAPDCTSAPGTSVACNSAGTLAANAPCQSDSQCASAYCKSPDATSASAATSDCGTCQAKADVGGACDDDDGCNTGLACDQTSQKCITPIAKGAACTVGGPACVSGQKCIANVCATALATGAKCDDAQQECVDGDECISSVCTSFEANITVVELGQPCGIDTTSGKETLCKAGSSCVGAAGATKCVASATVGQPCSSGTTSSPAGLSQDLPDCAGFLECTNGTCVKPDPNECK